MDSTLINIAGNGTGRKYWRSLDQLADTPEFQDWLHREFPEGASEMTDGASRRTLLKLMSASFGLAGLVACRRPPETILPMTKGIEDYVPGKAYFYSTVFPFAGEASGLLVETHDGRPTKIEGNPDHPFSLGAASAFAQASVLDLYDPDRSKSPLKQGRPVPWDELNAVLKQKFQGGGDGLRFLSESVNSPSLDAVKQHALQKFPGSKWVEYEPVHHDRALEAAQAAFGEPLAARYHFDKADVVLSFDCDFLGLDSGTLLPVKEFAKRRRVSSEESTMNRLYAVESQYSITGANADHRLRMRTCEIPGFAADLLNAVNGLNVVGGNKWLNAVAKELKAHRGRSIVIGGPRQDVSTHLAALALNHALGNFGETVSFYKASHSPLRLAEFQALVAEMAAGKVDTLVILGGNPVYTAPADLQFEANLKKVGTSIHLGVDADETALAATWHVPEAHYLESWSDAVSIDGTATVQQPMIEPPYGGRTKAELLAHISGYKDQRPYDIVRNHWSLPEKLWRKALHDGIIAQAGTPLPPPARAPQVSRPPAAAPGLELVFVPGWSTWDGRFNNNGWLQEAPDPMTKVVWGNGALVSAKTARDLGVAEGDVVRIQNGVYTAELPVLIQPGHADQSITVALGYGRRVTGRIGTGVGFNVYPLRTMGAFDYALYVQVTRTGRSEIIARTQNHGSMEGRPIVREATLAEYRKKPKFAAEGEDEPLESIYGNWSYDKGYQWGLSIDLNSCIGCNACLVACVAENNIPIVGKDQVMRGREMHWIRLDRYYVGDVSDPEVVTQPLPCQQCENAPCENVCPVAATTHSAEGLNDMAYNRCVGTRYCANNCPYKVRRFNFLNWHKNDTEVQKMVYNPDATVRMRGVMEKCNYCVQRIQEAKIQAKAEGHRPLQDGEIKTACQQTCPADAIVFGNINDPDSRVAKLKKQERNYALLGELNVRPRTTYLAKLRNPNPELANG